MNTQGSAYHEYEYGGTRPIMNMNSQKKHYSSVFNLNTAVFIMSSDGDTTSFADPYNHNLNRRSSNFEHLSFISIKRLLTPRALRT